MPNNRCVAEQRITSLLRKFKKNPEFFEEYKSFMETIIEKGYAVQVPVHQLNRDGQQAVLHTTIMVCIIRRNKSCGWSLTAQLRFQGSL